MREAGGFALIAASSYLNVMTPVPFFPRKEFLVLPFLREPQILEELVSLAARALASVIPARR
jgi:hypothetical protein